MKRLHTELISRTQTMKNEYKTQVPTDLHKWVQAVRHNSAPEDLYVI